MPTQEKNKNIFAVGGAFVSTQEKKKKSQGIFDAGGALVPTQEKKNLKAFSLMGGLSAHTRKKNHRALRKYCLLINASIFKFLLYYIFIYFI